MRKLWLITTEHLKAGLWFRDEEDYKVGMNFVALQAHASRVVVLSFTLMSNHVHFVLKADSKRDAKAFIEGFKHRYSLYLRTSTGSRSFFGETMCVSIPFPGMTKIRRRQSPMSK